MPSHLHEVLIEMFRDRPAFAADLLGGPLGVRVPAFDNASLSPGELTDVTPTEYRADAVVTLNAADKPVLAVVVEVQLRTDRRKRRTWPVYVATLYARLDCPTMLLVLCPDPVVATWCASPIVTGEPGLVLTPVVVGPQQVPVVTDVDLARRSPELAVLSALAHGAGAERVPVFEAMIAALTVVDHDHASLYTDLVVAVLPAAARACLEDLMPLKGFEYQSEFARRYFSEGEARGEAQALLAILEARAIEVPADVRADITACTDLATLDTWIRRAAIADKIQDLFD